MTMLCDPPIQSARERRRQTKVDDLAKALCRSTRNCLAWTVGPETEAHSAFFDSDDSWLFLDPTGALAHRSGKSAGDVGAESSTWWGYRLDAAPDPAAIWSSVVYGTTADLPTVTGIATRALGTGNVEELATAAGNTTNEFKRKLASFADLKVGWNGYEAQSPSATSRLTASGFLTALERHGIAPSRVAPSVVGGVGITLRHDGRKAYVEFYNDGGVHVLLSDGIDEPQTRAVVADLGWRGLMQEIRNYLYGGGF